MHQINNPISHLAWTYFGSMARRFKLYSDNGHCFMTSFCGYVSEQTKAGDTPED